MFCIRGRYARSSTGATLQEANVDVVYCMPSHGDSMGRIMTIQERMELLRWAQETGAYVIEDDYDSELRYYGKPVLSLQGLDVDKAVSSIWGHRQGAYISSFEIYLVLPTLLYTDFHRHRHAYGQSAGVLEQLAWAMYMEAGEWNKQIRRLRKHYLEKSKYFTRLFARQYLGSSYEVIAPEGGVYAGLRKTHIDGTQCKEVALRAGCDVIVVDTDDTNTVNFVVFQWHTYS